MPPVPQRDLRGNSASVRCLTLPSKPTPGGRPERRFFLLEKLLRLRRFGIRVRCDSYPRDCGASPSATGAWSAPR